MFRPDFGTAVLKRVKINPKSSECSFVFFAILFLFCIPTLGQGLSHRYALFMFTRNQFLGVMVQSASSEVMSLREKRTYFYRTVARVDACAPVDVFGCVMP